MGEKFIIAFLAFIAVALAFLLGSLIFYSINLNKSPIGSLECKTLVDNGKGVNIVIFGKEKDAKNYINFFLNTKPYSNNKKLFNFFLIENYLPECEVYKDAAILCYSRKLIKAASNCPSDQIMVLYSAKVGLRSSAYMNVMSVNKNHPLTVFLHEFGHTFTNLAEEYVPAKIPKGSKNCVKKCDDFIGEKDGCFKGCSRNDYERSVDNGVMRTLRSDFYGIYDEGLILKRLENFINSSTISGRAVEENCLKQEYILIEGKMENGLPRITKKSLQEGCIGDNGFGLFDLNFVFKNGEKIKKGSFNGELIFTDAPDSNGDGLIDGETYESDREFYLRIPFFDNVESLEIKDKEKNYIEKISLYDIDSRPCLIED